MDRVRETLFNWLQAEIVGSRCLDLFTGSGALGLEALSRNAAEVVMVDRNPKAIAMIKKNLALLEVDNASLVHADARDFLSAYADAETFDVVFLDPPFNQNLLTPFCEWLAQSGCLATQATIYIEMEKNASLPVLPHGWRVSREKQAGQLRYYLIDVEQPRT